MTDAPIEQVIIDGVDNPVGKSSFRAFANNRIRQRMADADEVRNTNLSGVLGIDIAGVLYDLDTSTTSADDGVTVIQDSAGNRFLVTAVPGTTLAAPTFRESAMLYGSGQNRVQVSWNTQNVVFFQGQGDNKTSSIHLNPGLGTLATDTVSEYVLQRTALQAFGGNYGRVSFSALGSGSGNIDTLHAEYGGTVIPVRFDFSLGLENPPATFDSWNFMSLGYTSGGSESSQRGAVWFGNDGQAAQRNQISLIRASLGVVGQRDSHAVLWEGKANDGTERAVWWRMFADVTSNAGASTFTWQSNLNGAGWNTRMTLTDTGLLTFQMAAKTIKGNNTAATAAAADLTVLQAQTVIGVPTVSVKANYNAVGDGVANDTAAIVAALADAWNNGYILVFPPGIYLTDPIAINNASNNTPRAVLGYGATLKARAASGSPLVTIDSPDNVWPHFAFSGFRLDADSKHAYGLKIHGCSNCNFEDLHIKGSPTAGGLWLSGEISFGVYFNLFKNIFVFGVTGPALIAKSVAFGGTYYVAANTFINCQFQNATTFGGDFDGASLSFLNCNFEQNTTSQVKILNSIQVDFTGCHIEGTTAITTGTNAQTNGLRVFGGRASGTITASALINPSNEFDTSDASANPIKSSASAIRAYPSGVFITGEVSGAFATGTLALAANTLYCFPLMLNGGATWTTIAFNVTTTGTAVNARLGIFKAGTDSLPDILLIDAGTVAVGTTGTKTVSFTQFLAPGLYYAVIVLDGTVTVNGAVMGTAGASNRWLEAIGVAAFNTAPDNQLSKAFAYGVLSGATPFGAVTRTAAGMPIIALRK